MKKRHINIPIFIPHLGCPNNCTFCNQKTISGVKEFVPESVIPIIEEALSTASETDDVEIAFFGGSFTGIDRDLMENLLFIANSYLKRGRINSIRCSTRPDYINDEIIDILKRHGVDTVELGLQSISDKVLSTCSRGHSFDDEINACKKIISSGIKLGGQMMIGLPDSTLEDEIKTARFIAEVGASEARIYPTIVFRDTELCNSMQRGEYTPLTVDEAVTRSAAAFKVFVENGVKVLRIGLCDSDNLHSDGTYVAGPNEAAIGEMVISHYYAGLIDDKLKALNLNFENKHELFIHVPTGHVSKVVGQHRKNKIRLLKEYGFSVVKVIESDDVSEYDVFLRIEERK
ncbi:MAG: radical SAM protein [Ruminococcaceae bacterium]|nr:radical SAM protein [Oscillospiraceae bacterium]